MKNKKKRKKERKKERKKGKGVVNTLACFVAYAMNITMYAVSMKQPMELMVIRRLALVLRKA